MLGGGGGAAGGCVVREAGVLCLVRMVWSILLLFEGGGQGR